MLAVARSVPSSGAAIEWHEANAESLPLPDGSFDVLVSSLGLQFVTDKTSALREMRRVLAPEGRLAIATVGPTPPLFTILEQALARHVKPEVAAFVQAVFSLYKPGTRRADEQRRIPERRRSVRDAVADPARAKGSFSGNTSSAPRWGSRRTDRRRGPYRKRREQRFSGSRLGISPPAAGNAA